MPEQEGNQVYFGFDEELAQDEHDEQENGPYGGDGDDGDDEDYSMDSDERGPFE